MTEAGRKWISQNASQCGFSTEYEQAEHWIRAFCEEVEKRADVKNDVSQTISRGKAFRELKRELLGDV